MKEDYVEDGVEYYEYALFCLSFIASRQDWESSMSRPSILVAEDRPDWREYLKETLQPFGVVQIAATYEDALDYIEKEQYDLATVDMAWEGGPLDLQDPDPEGVNLLQAVRESSHNRDCKVIMLTGYSRQFFDELASGYNIYDFFEKDSFNRGRFVERVRAALQEALQGRVKVKTAMPERLVRTGFVSQKYAAVSLDETVPLRCGQHYYFWLEIGALHSTAVDERAIMPEEQLAVASRLTVALFAFPNEIQVPPGEDTGELEIQGDNAAVVIRQPANLPELPSRPDLLASRLFFPVHMPDNAGTFRLRCNIYYEQILLQSRLFHVHVTSARRREKQAIRSVLDYALSRALSPAHLNRLVPHRLSLMLNSNSDGTHSFFFYGDDNRKFPVDKPVKDGITLDAGVLKDLIKAARGALRQAAWGNEEPWKEENTYRYGGQRDLRQLKTDLIRCALRGYILYDRLMDHLTGGYESSKFVAELMREPGRVQIAHKQSASLLVPAALFYDYRIDTGKVNASVKEEEEEKRFANYKLCPAFEEAFKNSSPLDTLECFQGNCPGRGDKTKTTICPSGFWGYRHAIGMPLPIFDLELPPEIVYELNPQFTVGVSTALPNFKDHRKKLESLRSGSSWKFLETRDEVLQFLGEPRPHLVYFYCHSGVVSKPPPRRPYIQVGSHDRQNNIYRDNFGAYDIYWRDSRPLVFINGCNSTALKPDMAIDFASGFIRSAASGVIGTEITIFESLACNFAEECLRSFLNDQMIGEAIRGARLKLLSEGNPLGLAYTPFVLASLRLIKKQSPHPL